MGLASKLAAAQAAQGAAPPAQQQSTTGGASDNRASSAQQQPGGYPQQQQYGQQPQSQQPGAYGQQPYGAQSGQGQKQSQPPVQQQYGGQQPGSYGQTPQQQPGAYGQQSYGAQSGQGQKQSQQQYGGQQPGAYGQPPQQQPGAYGQPPQQQQQQYGRPPAAQPQAGAYGGAPQGAQGAQGAQGGPQGGSQGGPANYVSILQKAIQENGLSAFYQPDQLQRIAATLPAKIDDVCRTWKIPKEIGVDLARLALYDIVIYADDSGSMSFEENGERIDDLKLILTRAAYIASLFDDNGIQVRFMNNTVQGDGLRNEQQVLQLLSQVQFRGLTPLGTSLRNKVLEPLVLGPARQNRLEKPVLILTITDGSPAGEAEGTILNVVTRTKRELSQTRYQAGAAAFQFAQVGNDLKARDFLAKLDNDPTVGAMVDCTSNFEVEQDEMAKLGVTLDPATWLVKMLLGAIDPSYDAQDEAR